MYMSYVRSRPAHTVSVLKWKFRNSAKWSLFSDPVTSLSNYGTLVGGHLGSPNFSFMCLRDWLGTTFRNDSWRSSFVFFDTINNLTRVVVLIIIIPVRPDDSLVVEHLIDQPNMLTPWLLPGTDPDQVPQLCTSSVDVSSGIGFRVSGTGVD